MPHGAVRFIRLVVATLLLPACTDGGDNPVGSPPFGPGFDGSGLILGSVSDPPATAVAVVLDASSMYVVGVEVNVGGGRWRIEKRALLDGVPDPGFGVGGVLFSDPTPQQDYPHAVALEGGDLYVAGFETNGLGERFWRIEKRSAATGQLDPVFGAGSGFVTVTRSGAFDSVQAVQVAGGSVYVSGTEAELLTTAYQWRIEKRSATTGALDAVFGSTTGVVRSDPDAAQDEPHAMVLDADSIYVAGYEHLSTGGYVWRIEKRDRGSGDLDGTFGGGTGSVTGVPTTVPPENTTSEAQVLALSGTALYVGGFQTLPGGGGGREWRVEKRNATTGLLDPAFGPPDGFVTSHFGTENELVSGLVVDGTTLYVAGTFDDTALLDIAWRIEKRDASTGALISAFGTAGALIRNPTAAEDILYGIAVNAAFIIAVGDQDPGSALRWRIERFAK